MKKNPSIVFGSPSVFAPVSQSQRCPLGSHVISKERDPKKNWINKDPIFSKLLMTLKAGHAGIACPTGERFYGQELSVFGTIIMWGIGDAPVDANSALANRVNADRIIVDKDTNKVWIFKYAGGKTEKFTMTFHF